MQSGRSLALLRAYGGADLAFSLLHVKSLPEKRENIINNIFIVVCFYRSQRYDIISMLYFVRKHFRSTEAFGIILRQDRLFAARWFYNQNDLGQTVYFTVFFLIRSVQARSPFPRRYGKGRRYTQNIVIDLSPVRSSKSLSRTGIFAHIFSEITVCTYIRYNILLKKALPPLLKGK